jgi:peroxiredoxin
MIVRTAMQTLIATATIAALVVSTALAQAPASQGQAPPPPPPSVKVGEVFPDFTLNYLAPPPPSSTDGRPVATPVRLSDYRGKQNVVLAFFPAAFSPGCTAEMTRYRDAAKDFSSAGVAVFGLSVDSTWANRAFRDQIGLDFPILSDFKKEVSRQAGILDEQSGMARRTTFVIDTEGIVRHIDQGSTALDPTGAYSACTLLKKKSAG